VGRSSKDFRKKRFEKEFVRKRGENLSKIFINFLLKRSFENFWKRFL
jgi:hypothetical protein